MQTEAKASGRRVPASGYKLEGELRCDAGDEARLMTIDGRQRASHGSRVYGAGRRRAWEDLSRETEW